MEKNLFEEGLNNNSVYYIYKSFMANNDFMEWEHRLKVMRQAKTDS